MDGYARGVVAGSVTGGLIGSASDIRVVNCYAACAMVPIASKSTATAAALGGLLGYADAKSSPLVTACFWDADLSKISVGAGLGPVNYGARD